VRSLSTHSRGLLYLGIGLGVVVLVFLRRAELAGNRTRVRRTALLLLGCWVLLAVYGSLAGLRPPTLPRTYFNLVPFRSFSSVPPRMLSEVAGNVALFVPLGMLLPLLSRRWSLPRVLLLALVLSTLLEVCQYVLNRGRLADIDDVMLNVSGALLGWLAWRLVIGGVPQQPRALSEPTRSDSSEPLVPEATQGSTG
jgi:glycopeptide antibiotics resistance protein